VPITRRTSSGRRLLGRGGARLLGGDVPGDLEVLAGHHRLHVLHLVVADVDEHVVQVLAGRPPGLGEPRRRLELVELRRAAAAGVSARWTAPAVVLAAHAWPTG
jgi:hypothetical protein